jgi:hypothetical protein
VGGAHLLLGKAGANHIDSFWGGLGGDLGLQYLEVEALLLDAELEVLGDLVFVDDSADTHADLPLALQSAGIHARAYLLQLLLRSFKQREALVLAPLRQLRITAGNQPLAWVVWV